MPELAYFARNLLRVVAKAKINATKLVEPARPLERREPDSVSHTDKTPHVVPCDRGHADSAPDPGALCVHAELEGQKEFGSRHQYRDKTYCA
jgi:hypothetical protein